MSQPIDKSARFGRDAATTHRHVGAFRPRRRLKRARRSHFMRQLTSGSAFAQESRGNSLLEVCSCNNPAATHFWKCVRAATSSHWGRTPAAPPPPAPKSPRQRRQIHPSNPAHFEQSVNSPFGTKSRGNARHGWLIIRVYASARPRLLRQRSELPTGPGRVELRCRMGGPRFE